MARAETKSPRALGFRRPAEWQPHRATWLAWPHHRTDFPGKLQGVRWVFCEMARQLSRGETVCWLVPDEKSRRQLGEHLKKVGVDPRTQQIKICRTNRSWTRDYLPEFVVSKRPRRLGAVKFRFNGWARYRDHVFDDAAGVRVAKSTTKDVWQPKRETKPWVLEGGAIDVDGQGTLMTTERCLLEGPRWRNRGQSRQQVEAMLGQTLGVDRVLWLPDGIEGDDTSGHVDDIARFVAPGIVVIAQEKNRNDENYRILKACKERLVGARDARGRKLEVIDLPMPAPLMFDGDRLPASYANFYIGNEVVLVPTFNDENDVRAVGILGDLFPKRRVIGIHSVDLILGLGSLHCSTHEEPLP